MQCQQEYTKKKSMVVDHLENNSNLCKTFVSQPVVSNDPYNADTEPPNAIKLTQ
jgi:hypothetical protein